MKLLQDNLTISVCFENSCISEELALNLKLCSCSNTDVAPLYQQRYLNHVIPLNLFFFFSEGSIKSLCRLNRRWMPLLRPIL